MDRATPQNDLYVQLCAPENLFVAFEKARKHKTLKEYVRAFEEQIGENLALLRTELIFHTYCPKPLVTFILRDPKTRKISKSDFRDRVVHHALCNIIEPILDQTFIYDSYANRKGKGTLGAIARFETFQRKVSRNGTRDCYVLKADIRHYFETVDHDVLIRVLRQKISDARVLWLIRRILDNYRVGGGDPQTSQVGMPLGNLTSQFFANVYLNELDQFVKHTLKVKSYIRYVDDFVLLHPSRKVLEECKEKINVFLQKRLCIALRPEKSKVLDARHGITFLGFRVFPQHKLIRKKNLRKFERKFFALKEMYASGMVSREYVIAVFEGWLAYVSNANTYKYRRHITRLFMQFFPLEPTTEIQNARKHATFLKKTEVLDYAFTSQKTLYLLKNGLAPPQIAVHRNVKESAVWAHIAQLIEYHQLSMWRILPKPTIRKILPYIASAEDSLKAVKERINDPTISYDMINCVRASLKQELQKKNVARHVQWHKKAHCFRKCFWNPHQRAACADKFDRLVAQNPALALSRKEFLDLFNDHMMICVLPESEKRHFVSWYEFVTYIKKYPPKRQPFAPQV